MKNINFERGFTLLELILTLVLLTVVLGSAYSFYFMGLNSYHGGVNQIDLQQNARIAMDKISSELKFADYYSIKDTGEKIYFFFPDENTLHTFRLRGKDLEYCIGSGVTKVAYNVDSLEFFYGKNGTVAFIITVKDQSREYSLSSSVKPRNLKD